ncbi:MAG: hypothetical protein JW874_14275 [Spirochaetales bacterium]|nr:hypothetical protein [Spirochaetales bacterium]
MTDSIICTFRNNIAEIIRIADSVPEKDLTIQSDEFIPATHCHPLWTLGHLCVSIDGMRGEFGIEVPDDENLFVRWGLIHGQQSEPQNNPALYQSRIVLKQTLQDRLELMTGIMEKTPREQYERPIPDIRFRNIYPTLYHCCAAIFVGHTSEHVQMLSLWKYFVFSRVLKEFNEM